MGSGNTSSARLHTCPLPRSDPDSSTQRVRDPALTMDSAMLVLTEPPCFLNSLLLPMTEMASGLQPASWQDGGRPVSCFTYSPINFKRKFSAERTPVRAPCCAFYVRGLVWIFCFFCLCLPATASVSAQSTPPSPVRCPIQAFGRPSSPLTAVPRASRGHTAFE